MTPLHRIRDRWDAFAHQTERTIAPHVDGDWAEALLLELRLRGVPGDAVGAVLAEVDAHVVDSGTSARESFGDPVAYARSLELPTAVDGPRELARTGAPVAAQVLGMLLTLWAAAALLASGPLTVTAGHLAALLLLAVQLGVLLLRPDPFLRTAVEHPVVTWLALMTLMGLTVAAVLALPQPVLSSPAGPVLVVGLLLLAAGTAVALRRHRSGADLDPVLSPLPDGGHGADLRHGAETQHGGDIQHGADIQPGTKTQHGTRGQHGAGARQATPRWGSVGVWLVPVWTAVLLVMTTAIATATP